MLRAVARAAGWRGLSQEDACFEEGGKQVSCAEPRSRQEGGVRCVLEFRIKLTLGHDTAKKRRLSPQTIPF